MAPVNKAKIVEKITSNISANYGIDGAILTDFSSMMMNALAEYYVYDSDPTKAPRKSKAAKDDAAKGPKKPRKTSAYNVYVKKMMQEPDIKTIPQKEKMAKIGERWATVPQAEKDSYQAQADAENSANPALADATTASNVN